jgi:hypothetical protein
VYDAIEFDVTGKQREVEFNSTSKHVPFQMQFNFGLDRTASNFEVATRFSGYDILAVQKFFRAFRILRAGGELELFDLKRQQSLGQMRIELSPVNEEREQFEELTDRLLKSRRLLASG